MHALPFLLHTSNSTQVFNLAWEGLAYPPPQPELLLLPVHSAASRKASSSFCNCQMPSCFQPSPPGSSLNLESASSFPSFKLLLRRSSLLRDLFHPSFSKRTPSPSPAVLYPITFFPFFAGLNFCPKLDFVLSVFCLLSMKM